MGLLNRMTKRSVDMALRMQPRRTARVRDEILYAAPAERDNVQQIHDAGERMVAAGLCPPLLGVVASRRNDATITRTMDGVDLAAIDNRMLATVTSEDDHPVIAAIAECDAAVWALPPHLMATERPEALLDLGYPTLAAAVGSFSSDPAGMQPGVCVLPGRGVVAAGTDPEDAVSRLEAAELLAKIKNLKQEG